MMRPRILGELLSSLVVTSKIQSLKIPTLTSAIKRFGRLAAGQTTRFDRPWNVPEFSQHSLSTME